MPTWLLAFRYRLRVLIAASVAAGVIAFLITGLGGFVGVVHNAYVGGLTGFVKRKGYHAYRLRSWAIPPRSLTM